MRYLGSHTLGVSWQFAVTDQFDRSNRVSQASFLVHILSVLGHVGRPFDLVALSFQESLSRLQVSQGLVTVTRLQRYQQELVVKALESIFQLL